jgi:hypothetical protein
MTTHIIDGYIETSNRRRPRRVTMLSADDGAGLAPNATLQLGGLTVTEAGDGVLHRTTFTFSAFPLAVTDALAYASKQLYDFPAGRILILGSTASLAWAVTTDRDTTINNSASLTWAVGTAAASNITLATTMVDLLPKITKVLDGAVTAYTTASGGALAATTHFDGTSTSKDAFLNVGFETNTDIDGDGTLNVTGSITIHWINLGDY